MSKKMNKALCLALLSLMIISVIPSRFIEIHAVTKVDYTEM